MVARPHPHRLAARAAAAEAPERNDDLLLCVGEVGERGFDPQARARPLLPLLPLLPRLPLLARPPCVCERGFDPSARETVTHGGRTWEIVAVARRRRDLCELASPRAAD